MVPRPRSVLSVALAATILFGCSGASVASSSSASTSADSGLTLAPGFAIARIARVRGARELAVLPSGDVLVGTSGASIDIVPDPEAAVPSAPHVFMKLSEGPAAGIAYAPNGSIYVATNTTIWRLPYVPGARSATGAVAIAHVRTGPVAPNSDGDVHRTTSVIATATRLYAAVGSSCNACVESDPTRATVQQMALDGSGMTTLATRARNAIALAIDPASKALWIGGAGQDGLAYGHPYEYLDSPTSHGASRVDYGWPQCEENHHAYNALGANPAPDCSTTIAPAIAFPAYATLIGATFYPADQTGAHAFPRAYRGGLFVTSHGSWHCCPATPPRVYFVAMSGDRPVTAVNWSDPTAQSVAFVSGLGSASNNSYLARPTGIAVGSQGSLLVADDQNGAIYRIRPNGTSHV